MIHVIAISAGLVVVGARDVLVVSSPGTNVRVVGGAVSWWLVSAGESAVVVTPDRAKGVVLLSGGLLRVTARGVNQRPEPMPETQPWPAAWWDEDVEVVWGGPADINCDGDSGTDADIEAFFACLGGTCCATCTGDFDGDGDVGTDGDIQSFYGVLSWGKS